MNDQVVDDLHVLGGGKVAKVSAEGVQNVRYALACRDVFLRPSVYYGLENRDTTSKAYRTF
jgi:hypothetical protein